MTKTEVDKIIMQALNSLYEEKPDEMHPFFMSDVQRKVKKINDRIYDCHWTDRMQRHCFRLQTNGKLFLLKTGNRYLLSLPDREIPPGYEIVTSDILPDHRLIKRKKIFAQIASHENLDSAAFMSLRNREWDAISNTKSSSGFNNDAVKKVIMSFRSAKSDIVWKHIELIRSINVDGINLGSDEYIFDKIAVAIHFSDK